MNWTRKTEFGQFAPYLSEDGRFIVADMSMSSNSHYVTEYAELKRNSWNSKEDHAKLLSYCREHKLKLNGANWVLVDNETGETLFPFKTAKAAKEHAESIYLYVK